VRKFALILLTFVTLALASCSFSAGQSYSPKLKARNSIEQKFAARFGKDYAKIIIKYDLFGLSHKSCVISDLYSDVFNQKVHLTVYQSKINKAYSEFKFLTEEELEVRTFQRLNIIAKRYNATAAQLGIMPAKYKPKKNSLVKMLAATQKMDQKFRAVPTIHPVKKYIVTSHYGQRIHPIKGTSKLHKGIDLISKADHYPIYASNDGKVIVSSKDSGYGNYVIVDHGNDIRTVYAHLSKVSVKKGAKINAGQVVGIMGDSGLATAMHLHFEVRIKDRPINPASLLKFNNCR